MEGTATAKLEIMRQTGQDNKTQRRRQDNKTERKVLAGDTEHIDYPKKICRFGKNSLIR